MPSEISVGESALLTWSTEYAKTCSIEPGLSTVNCNGEQAVTPSQDTTYTLTATGTGGTTTAEISVSVSPMTLTITSPISGANLSRRNVMVSGTVSHSNGLETGVVVNGVTALVYGGQFVANHVPLIEGTNTITAIGIDVNGKTIEESVSLVASYPAHSIVLSLDTEIGIAPLEAELQYKTNFTPVSSPTFTYMGSAELGFAAGEEPGAWVVTATSPGIYTFLYETIDDQGDTHTDEIAFLAMDKTFLDNLLQAKWDNMKTAMTAGDIEAAIQEFTYSQRDTFTEIFTIQSAKLAQIASEMQDIQFIYAKNDTAEYRILRDVMFEGALETITFFIYFDRGIDGIWRIRDF